MSNSVAKVLCGCSGQSAEFQNKQYGKDVRVANFVTKSEKPAVNTVDVKCTVCGKLHQVKKSSLS